MLLSYGKLPIYLFSLCVDSSPLEQPMKEVLKLGDQPEFLSESRHVLLSVFGKNLPTFSKTSEDVLGW